MLNMRNPDIYDVERVLPLLRRHGLDTAELRDWEKKLSTLRVHAKERGLQCKLVLSQYVRLAIKAGIRSPIQIGCRNEQFNLGRLGDKGGYEVGNCRFITSLQNRLEMKQNGGIVKRIQTLEREFVLVSPSGKKYRGANLTEFAIEHGLDRSNLAKVCRGDRPEHRGWTGKYVAER